MLNETTRSRLLSQLSNLEMFVRPGEGGAAWNRKPESGKWTARENLAHLARYHEIFGERLKRMLEEERPRLERYRAEDDRQWPMWSSLDTTTLLAKIHELREQLTSQLMASSREQMARTGIHPVLGEMDIPLWLEFFLLHEAHHLYAILFRLRE